VAVDVVVGAGSVVVGVLGACVTRTVQSPFTAAFPFLHKMHYVPPGPEHVLQSESQLIQL
jgi:hypothetical protein